MARDIIGRTLASHLVPFGGRLGIPEGVEADVTEPRDYSTERVRVGRLARAAELQPTALRIPNCSAWPAVVPAASLS